MKKHEGDLASTLSGSPDRASGDGGPAFPQVEWNMNGGHWEGRYEIYQQHAGMSLRDYFAATAMPIVATANSSPSAAVVFVTREYYASLATDAYALADAMLKARATGLEHSAGSNDKAVSK